MLIDQRVAILVRRLDATEVIDPSAQPHDRVLFGATVTVRDADDVEHVYRIVGVYEADPKRGWISWRAPIARALTGRSLGDVVTVKTPAGEQELEVIAIRYD